MMRGIHDASAIAHAPGRLDVMRELMADHAYERIHFSRFHGFGCVEIHCNRLFAKRGVPVSKRTEAADAPRAAAQGTQREAMHSKEFAGSCKCAVNRGLMQCINNIWHHSEIDIVAASERTLPT